MNLIELQKKLTTAARLQKPDDRVPYAFEKRIMAHIAARAVDRWSAWGNSLWRAAASCVAIAIVCAGISLYAPQTSDNNNDLSQDFENTLLASADQADPRTVNYWKVIIATIVIFGAGVFTGGLLVNYVHQTYLRAAAHHPPAAASNNVPASTNSAGIRLPEVLSKPFLPKLDNLIHLSTDQHKAIEKIIAEAQGQMKKMIMDTQTNVRAQLTPEQRAQFDEVMKHPKHTASTNAVNKASASALPPLTNLVVAIPTNPPATN